MRRIHVSLAGLFTIVLGLLVLGAATSPAGAAGKKPKRAPKITSKANYTARGSVGDAYVKNA
ncbi:MAG TPA: hypothetical protein P5138_01470 [Solirubrobacterales bacterium]|nr:hypothetical protein [Solirubrobacterales bacterium]